MKSHVGMEQKVCPVCGQAFDTETILLDKRLRSSLERKTVTGWDLCPRHKKLWQIGYVALVACDPERSKFTGCMIKPEDACRTGRIAHVSKAVARDVFNREITTSVAFVEPEVINMLEKMLERSKRGD